jgi:hypothetical protein
MEKLKKVKKGSASTMLLLMRILLLWLLRLADQEHSVLLSLDPLKPPEMRCLVKLRSARRRERVKRGWVCWSPIMRRVLLLEKMAEASLMVFRESCQHLQLRMEVCLCLQEAFYEGLWRKPEQVSSFRRPVSPQEEEKAEEAPSQTRKDAHRFSQHLRRLQFFCPRICVQVQPQGLNHWSLAVVVAAAAVGGGPPGLLLLLPPLSFLLGVHLLPPCRRVPRAVM